jgi:heme-degrading monooxygenase HmoA
MLIIAGHYQVPKARRDEYVAAHADLVSRGRAHPGCIDLAIAPDPVDEARVNMFEIWESEAALGVWRKACDPPRTGIDIKGAEVRKHLVARSGSPFEPLEG